MLSVMLRLPLELIAMLDLVVSVSETLTVYVLSAISRTFMQTTEVSVNGFLQGEV